MKRLIWMVSGLIALFWTGGALLATGIIQWAGPALGSGEAESLGNVIAQWPVPQWVSLWMDPAAIESMQASVLWGVEAFREALPVLGSAVGWLVPLLWVLWLLGLVAMFVLAFGLHMLLGRQGRFPARGT